MLSLLSRVVILHGYHLSLSYLSSFACSGVGGLGAVPRPANPRHAAGVVALLQRSRCSCWRRTRRRQVDGCRCIITSDRYHHCDFVSFVITNSLLFSVQTVPIIKLAFTIVSHALRNTTHCFTDYLQPTTIRRSQLLTGCLLLRWQPTTIHRKATIHCCVINIIYILYVYLWYFDSAMNA